jgi:two-component system cell cycle response regulator
MIEISCVVPSVGGDGVGRSFSEPMRLLVAEDDSEVRGLLRATFELQGLSVVEASDGESVIQLARELQPDLLLLDVHLGGDDGFELCRQLKADPATAGIPVIFLTGRHQVRDRVRGLQLGAVDYVGKPFEYEELLARVTAALRIKATQDALRARQQELETLASTDPLTGLFNRRFFDERIAQEVARARRYHHPLAFAMLDLDHFKQINDRYGHAAGDRALRLLADVVRTELRVPDVAVRWGGEEFLLILPETDRDRAGLLVERIRERLLSLPLTINGESVPLRVSGGVAQLRLDCRLDDPIERADQALLRAKRDGRDRVCLG